MGSACLLSWRGMRPILCAGLVVGLLIGTAGWVRAERTYVVRVVSDPPGATLYIDDKEKGAVGTTPYKGRLPRGPHVLVLELDGYEPAVQDIEVKKRRKLQMFRIELTEVSNGTVEVDSKPKDTGSFGAQIFVDGKESGELPEILELPAGAHQLEVKKKGYRSYDEWIEVAKGETLKVLIALEPLGGANKGKKGSAKRGPKGTGPRISAGAGLEVGFRSYGYDGVTAGTLLPIDTGMVALLRLVVEINPFARSRNTHLQRLSIAGDLAVAAPIESTTDDGTQVVDTSWREGSVALRYTFPLSGPLSAAAHVGYGGRSFTFDNPGGLAGALPDVDYRNYLVGGDLIVRRGDVYGSAGGDWLSTSSAGPLAERFSGASVSAYELRVGGGAMIEPRLELRISAHLARYTHTFTSMAGDMFQATGGTDRFYGATVGVVYRR